MLVLAYGIALFVGLVGALVAENNNLFTIANVIILAVIIAFPIWALGEDFGVELRTRHGLPSRVFKSAEVDLSGDYDTLMVRILQILSDMGAGVALYAPVIGHVKTEFPGHDFVVEVRKVPGDSNYRVLISSDSVPPTIRIDFGTNKRYVNEFAERLAGCR